MATMFAIFEQHRKKYLVENETGRALSVNAPRPSPIRARLMPLLSTRKKPGFDDLFAFH
jgi:hypothetical protein